MYNHAAKAKRRLNLCDLPYQGDIIAIMPDRKGAIPAVNKLSFLSQVHNAVLIALSAGMAASAIYWARRGRYNFWGNAYKPSETEMGLTIYVFYISKFYEFFDTVRPPPPSPPSSRLFTSFTMQ